MLVLSTGQGHKSSLARSRDIDGYCPEREMKIECGQILQIRKTYHWIRFFFSMARIQNMQVNDYYLVWFGWRENYM
jgi:hypothetical protein